VAYDKATLAWAWSRTVPSGGQPLGVAVDAASIYVGEVRALADHHLSFLHECHDDDILRNPVPLKRASFLEEVIQVDGERIQRGAH
jgi:hypothetical protein